MTKYVLTSGTHSDRTVYHTDEGCMMLQRATNYREASATEIERQDLSECKFCAGESETAGEQDRSYLRALKQAGKENAE